MLNSIYAFNIADKQIGAEFHINDANIQQRILDRLYLSESSMLQPAEYVEVVRAGRTFRIYRNGKGGYTRHEVVKPTSPAVTEVSK